MEHPAPAARRGGPGDRRARRAGGAVARPRQPRPGAPTGGPACACPAVGGAMRLPAIVDAPLEAAARVGWHGLAVRSVIGVAAVGCWAVAAAVGEANLPMTLLVALTGLVSVTRPDSGAPLALIAVLGLLWIVEVRPLSVGWSLVLAISVLLVHTAAARAAAMGDGAAIGADVARRWLAQTT